VADYEKMYALLCGTVDDVIDPLEKIPEAKEIAEKLREALLEAEEMYVSQDACHCATGPQTGCGNPLLG